MEKTRNSSSSIRSRKTIKILTRKKPNMLITDENGNQNRMNTIEIETYRAERSPISGCLERKTSVKETISNRTQLGKLNFHLKNLGGDVKDI